MMDETQARKVLADAIAPPKPGQLVDPPEVARYAQRGDPPISEWPGRAVTRKDRSLPKKQRHTAKRIYERLRAEHGFDGKFKDYVRERRRRTQEMYVPLSHPAGDAQCDFGQAKAVHRRSGADRPLLRAGPSPQRRMLRQGLPRRDDRGVLRRSRLGLLVPGWRAPEHRLRQHETGRGQDPGRRLEEAYPRLLGARIPPPVRGAVRPEKHWTLCGP